MGFNEERRKAFAAHRPAYAVRGWSRRNSFKSTANRAGCREGASNAVEELPSTAHNWRTWRMKTIQDNVLTGDQRGDGCSDEHGENAEITVGRAHLGREKQTNV